MLEARSVLHVIEDRPGAAATWSASAEFGGTREGREPCADVGQSEVRFVRAPAGERSGSGGDGRDDDGAPVVATPSPSALDGASFLLDPTGTLELAPSGGAARSPPGGGGGSVWSSVSAETSSTDCDGAVTCTFSTVVRNGSPATAAITVHQVFPPFVTPLISTQSVRVLDDDGGSGGVWRVGAAVSPSLPRVEYSATSSPTGDVISIGTALPPMHMAVLSITLLKVRALRAHALLARVIICRFGGARI